MKNLKISRRNFIRLAIGSIPIWCVADTFFVEPKWIKIKKLKLSKTPTSRIAHFTDLHYKGDYKFLKQVVDKINNQSPDFVCFTGDIVERKQYIEEAAEILSGIKSPLYGIPGNHDYWSGASFDSIEKSFESTGGKWLVDEEVITQDGTFKIIGLSHLILEKEQKISEKILGSKHKNVLLIHYPAWARKLKEKYSVILSGHSHGGQIRLPIIGAIVVPFEVERYNKGLYKTPSGPMYVNPGIGTWLLPIRFLCRPEITVIEI